MPTKRTTKPKATESAKKPTKRTTKSKATKSAKKPTRTTTKKVEQKKETPKKTGPSKAEQLCAGIHTLHDEAVELAESVFFMADQLKAARIKLATEELIIPYDNGGGQSGIRENPHFIAYEHLMATYTKSLRQLEDMIGKGAPVRNSKSILTELTTIAGKKAAR